MLLPLPHVCRSDHFLAMAFLPSMLIRRMAPVMAVSSTTQSASQQGEASSIKEEGSGQVGQKSREEYWKPPEGMVKAPWYRRNAHQDPPNTLAEETLNPADVSSSGWRLDNYYKVQKLVNMLPTVKEKIDFVNPYERDWSQSEKRWHRPWLQHLLRPRSAWGIQPTPTHFAALDFYKYITKTRLAMADEAEQEFHSYYKNLTLPTSKFEKRVAEHLALFLEREALADRENHPAEERANNRAKFLRTLIDEAHFALAYGNPRIIDHRISHSARCESFWIRAGFRSLYDQLPIWETDEAVGVRKTRFTGDDRRRLGELAFTMRDQHVLQVRDKNSMKNLFDLSDKAKLESPLFPATFKVEEEVIFSPKMYNILPDKDPLWQCPGYEYDSGETHKFGRLAVKDVSPLFKRLDYWHCDSEMERMEVLEECLAATAVVSLFNWLNGQAHCLGHTQFTEILHPLSSQLVLSDGHQMFYFALGQLNTIAINIDVEGFDNPRTNYCCVEGPFKLYDEFHQNGIFRHLDPRSGEMKDGLNPHVLERILQMCVVH